MRMLQPLVKALNTRFGRPAAPELDGGFYQSPQWRALRALVLKEAKYRCQWDGCGRTDGRMHADHIVEIEDGGARLDRSNVWCLCQAHHNVKTSAERQAREGQKT